MNSGRVKKMLITDGAGSIGSAIVRQFINETGISVINVDVGNLESLALVSDHPRYFFEHADMLDRVVMERIFKQCKPDIDRKDSAHFIGLLPEDWWGEGAHGGGYKAIRLKKQEKITFIEAIDILRKMEKYDIVHDFDDWLGIRLLRNSHTHEYLTDDAAIIENINAAVFANTDRKGSGPFIE